MSDALLDAIQNRDIDRVATLLAAGVDPNEPGNSRYGYGPELPLHAAIGELQAFGEDSPGGPEPGGPIDPVVLLLRYGARVKGWDPSRDGDPLLRAVEIGHLEAVRLLLAAGADPNVSDNEGYAPLRVCADKGFVEIARLLLLCGATKTIEDWGGQRAMTALGFAARGLHVEMVKLLLGHGADPEGRDVDGLTPLDCLEFVDSPGDPAAQSRILEIRRLLGCADRKAPASDPSGNQQVEVLPTLEGESVAPKRHRPPAEIAGKMSYDDDLLDSVPPEDFELPK